MRLMDAAIELGVMRPGKVLSMGSENEIRRYEVYITGRFIGGKEETRVANRRTPEGEWVKYADHVAARKADQERIDELEEEVKFLRGVWWDCSELYSRAKAVVEAPGYEVAEKDLAEIVAEMPAPESGKGLARVSLGEALADASEAFLDRLPGIEWRGKNADQEYEFMRLAQEVEDAAKAVRASLSTGESERDPSSSYCDGTCEETGECCCLLRTDEGGFAAGVTKNDGVNTTEGEDEN